MAIVTPFEKYSQSIFMHGYLPDSPQQHGLLRGAAYGSQGFFLDMFLSF